jgi:hypothetical protein
MLLLFVVQIIPALAIGCLFHGLLGPFVTMVDSSGASHLILSPVILVHPVTSRSKPLPTFWIFSTPGVDIACSSSVSQQFSWLLCPQDVLEIQSDCIIPYRQWCAKGEMLNNRLWIQTPDLPQVPISVV